METILKFLEQDRPQYDWEELQDKMRPVPIQYIGQEPVFEFFNTLSDDLYINPQPISISVNPIESEVPFHLHNYVEMIVVLKGRADIVMEHETLELQQGDILVVGTNTIHRNRKISSEDLVVNIAMKSTAFSLNDLDFMRQGTGTNLSDMLFFGPADSDFSGSYTIFKTENNAKIRETMLDIIEEYYHTDIQSNQLIRLSLLSLFARLIRLSANSAQVTQKNAKSSNTLLSLLLYIEKNYATATLEDMGEEFGFNPNYLSTYLKKHTGKSFIKLIHLQRVNIAAEFLTLTSAPIEKIAIKVGYENPSYFYKVFRKIVGMSPAEYRDNFQN
ncbi:AraC family transcriptional regulator [Streptococcus ovuberis]|uniref:AraC family transcriptional regulator n=1 Tax=Streptococcus ovuberis TaxID=1936207 RepID=A0A7X6MWW7_9STRE|nr:helix-turn-helix domain-containing protein [Streptococcus ovuberis]NKZ19875.1 AraC family transcriptional regulator [Streptococcus ovuberis]